MTDRGDKIVYTDHEIQRKRGEIMENAVCVFMPNCILAEGCVWNRQEDALYFVDIEGCQIFRWKPGEERADVTWTDRRVGCLVFHQNGGIVTAESSRLVCRNGKEQTVLLDQDLPDYLRYNDGKCDRFGNLWVGTMAVSQNHPAARGGGSLYCIKNGQVAAEYGGFTIPNGMAWSQDGSVFYHIDTALRRVDAYDVEDEIRLVNRRTVVAVPEEEGSPDGMCMDGEGNLWIAMWGGGRVNGYHLPTGKKEEEIKVPDPYVSCCCFGGRDDRELYITTARAEDGSGGQIYRTKMQTCGGRIYKYGGTYNGT